MDKVTLTIDQLAALEAHTDLTSDFSYEDTRAVRVHLTKEGKLSYDIDGANDIACGNWSGIEWDELFAWAGLAQGVENGDVVFDKQTGDIFLAYEWDDEDKYVFVGTSSGDAQKEGWADETGNALEGIRDGEYRLPYDMNRYEDRSAFWQKNTEVNSPVMISDYNYNGGFFQLRSS